MALPNVVSLAYPSVVPIAEQAPRILLFDGGSALGPAVMRALEATGCELRVHLGPEHATDVLASFAPDLVLVDVDVAHGGVALCGELRATEVARELPIVLVAGATVDPDAVTRGLMCGADDFVTLGDRQGEFQARVRVQLRNKRDRDRLRRLRVERDTLRREATVDALTGIPNRRSVDAVIDDAWSKGQTFSVVFVDVDDFKQVNDCYGHDAGDQVLCAVAAALAAHAGSAVVGRFGGEEFVVVVSDAMQGAEALAERLRRAVEAVRIGALGSRPVTASFGVATFEPKAPDRSSDALCQRADAALYEAKRSGKNRVVAARSLATRPGHVSLRMPAVSVAEATDPRAALEAALLRELATGRAGLPVLPAAADEALRLAEDPRTDLVRIALLVERDPPLAARFIAVAGSALYSRGVKPASTHAAIVRIGLATSRDLLLQVAYERSGQELPAFHAEVARSFSRSVSCAIAARMLSFELRQPLESAYLCGLLHDIGEARVYRLLAAHPYAVAHPDLAAELVHRHHQRAGADVARSWRLSNEIIEVCASHHGAAPTSVPLRLVAGADLLVALLERADGPTVADEAALAHIGIAPERLPELLDRVRAAVSAASPKEGSGPPRSLSTAQARAVRVSPSFGLRSR